MPEQKPKQEVNKQTQKSPPDLAPIPDKLYFTIGEVSKLCALKPHVLRYWENEFPHLSPSKRRGNRRYYQRKDVLLVRKIRHLLYDQGFTIEGAKAQLTDENATLQQIQHPIYQILKETITHLEEALTELQ